MPRGLNRSGNFSHGSPVTLPHEFGNPVNWKPAPEHFGNPVVKGNDPAQFGNDVDWPTPDPAHFGNIINPNSTSRFELENGTGVLLLESGDFLLLEQ